MKSTADHANTSDRLNPADIPDLWLTEPDDEQSISAPVARLIHRRLPTGSDELGNPDLGDAIEALIALWFYARKQVAKIRDWRRARRDVEQEMGDTPNDANATG